MEARQGSTHLWFYHGGGGGRRIRGSGPSLPTWVQGPMATWNLVSKTGRKKLKTVQLFGTIWSFLSLARLLMSPSHMDTHLNLPHLSVSSLLFPPSKGQPYSSFIGILLWGFKCLHQWELLIARWQRHRYESEMIAAWDSMLPAVGSGSWAHHVNEMGRVPSRRHTHCLLPGNEEEV